MNPLFNGLKHLIRANPRVDAHARERLIEPVYVLFELEALAAKGSFHIHYLISQSWAAVVGVQRYLAPRNPVAILVPHKFIQNNLIRLV